MNTTRKELQVKVDYLNRILGRPEDSRQNGHLYIDHYSPGGNPYTYKLGEIAANGAEHAWTNYRMTRAEFNCYLSGLIEGISLMRDNQTNNVSLPRAGVGNHRQA